MTRSQMKTTLHTGDTAKDWFDAVCLQQNRFVGLRALSNEERVKEADVPDVLSVATVAPGPRAVAQCSILITTAASNEALNAKKDSRRVTVIAAQPKRSSCNNLRGRIFRWKCRFYCIF